MIAWYKFLRSKGYTIYESIDGAIHNNKYWYPEGDWPYGMKRK